MSDDCDEALNEADEPIVNANGEKAWMMDQILQRMNNEDAYFGGWLYIWPDGETKEEAEEDFAEDEDFKDLEDSFIRHYTAYHNDGLYNASEEVVKAAHEWDEKLGLDPIENIEDEYAVKPLDEAEEENSEEE